MHRGQRIIDAEVLLHPTLNNKNFDSISLDEYKWEDRSFFPPFLSKKRKGEVFAIEGMITSDEAYLKMLDDKVYTAKAKKHILSTASIPKKK